jgi:FAD/FMN-containing dehydrogenase
MSEASALLEHLRASWGAGRVLSADAAGARYGANTIAVRRRIAGAALAASTDDVVEAVRAANRFGVALYPISTGRNWGYGSANPVTDDCVVLDLSPMTTILDIEPDLGVVTVQPGVTQRQMKQYLDERRLNYLVPIHGGGPDCSLIGNALERGYGIPPISDHFSAVTALAAVLPDGSVYRGALESAGAGLVERLFKWGVGPYLDGLFTQSNLGIVTEMTITLARRPARIEPFYFWVKDDAQLEATVCQVREVIATYPGLLSGINLMNERRMLSMMIPFPKDAVPPGQTMSAELVGRLRAQRGVTAWTGVGALYGDAGVVRAARAGIARLLRPVANRVIFMTRPKAERLRRLAALLPRRWGGGLVKMLDLVLMGQAIFEGGPTEVALPLAYWKSGRLPTDGRPYHPAADGCGLIWYSPLVPMKPETVRRYVDTVRAVCARNAIEPLITLTTLSERCIDSTVPILFDRASAEDAGRAHACYAELLEAGRACDCFPYRFGIDHMASVVDPGAPAWQLVAALKAALDPRHVLAPGRYCPPP